MGQTKIGSSSVLPDIVTYIVHTDTCSHEWGCLLSSLHLRFLKEYCSLISLRSCNFVSLETELKEIELELKQESESVSLRSVPAH